MRRRRTIYFNDARHYYLFVFEPPMNLEDAWVPIDECAGTAVDTFIYGVERSDGLYYPSKVGMQFGADMPTFPSPAYWRAWNNMQSLTDRGLDPLTVLIDRAHDKGMDFFASLRMSGYGGLDPRHRIGDHPNHGDFAHPEVRDHQFAVLRELSTDYSVDGVELDFAFVPRYFKDGEAERYTPMMTGYVEKISEMVRSRPGGPGVIGTRVLPTEEMCIRAGLDIRTWLKQGLVDFVVSLHYQYWCLDPVMPIDWLVQAAHEVDVPVYGMLQPYVSDETTGSPVRVYPTPEVMRAAAASYWDRGVDGLYTWFMQWPLDSDERRILTEIGDPDLIREGDKRYVLPRRSEESTQLGYDATLPVEIPGPDPGKRYPVPFYVADDVEGSVERIRQVRLRIQIDNLVSADRLTVLLNGESLAGESCQRDFRGQRGVYRGQWLEFLLRAVRPRRGWNTLEVSLDGRPDRLVGGVSVENVEVVVEYSPYPSGLSPLDGA